MLSGIMDVVYSHCKMYDMYKKFLFIFNFSYLHSTMLITTLMFASFSESVSITFLSWCVRCEDALLVCHAKRVQLLL